MNPTVAEPLPVAPEGLRVAIAGCGRMGMRHIQAAQSLGMRVCAVADMTSAAVEQACAAAGLAASCGYSDARQMLASVRPDAVVVSTTAPAHDELVLAAAAQGARFVLCEKPMATSLAAADAMIDACRRAGTALAVNHQMRYMPQYTQVKALVGSEALGPLSSIVVAGSNFGLAMNLCHYFEMLRYMTDSPVRSVQAWLDPDELPNPRGPQFQDRSGRLIAFSELGPTMYADFTAAAGHGLQCIYICRYGQIVVDELRGEMRITSRQAEYRSMPTTRYGMPADSTQVMIEPVDTVVPTATVWRGMLAGRDWPDGTAGRSAQACLVAAHLSHEEGNRVVQIDGPALPLARRFPWA
jgi:predicted dehydrogenase